MLEFIERLRGEQKFSSVEALVTQIRADIEKAKELLQQK
jgi:FAD synthase